jgi:hypothetical protein
VREPEWLKPNLSAIRFAARSLTAKKKFFNLDSLASMCRKPGAETDPEILDLLSTDQPDSKSDHLVPRSAVYLELKIKQVSLAAIFVFSTSGLYYKTSMIVIYDLNDSGLYSKSTMVVKALQS